MGQVEADVKCLVQEGGIAIVGIVANVGIPAPYIIRWLVICLLLIIAFDCI